MCAVSSGKTTLKEHRDLSGSLFYFAGALSPSRIDTDSHIVSVPKLNSNAPNMSTNVHPTVAEDEEALQSTPTPDATIHVVNKKTMKRLP